jgi:hypothetical protein
MAKKTQASKSSQSAKFQAAAKEAGCSDDETAFDAALRKIGTAKVVEPKSKAKPSNKKR